MPAAVVVVAAALAEMLSILMISTALDDATLDDGTALEAEMLLLLLDRYHCRCCC